MFKIPFLKDLIEWIQRHADTFDQFPGSFQHRFLEHPLNTILPFPFSSYIGQPNNFLSCLEILQSISSYSLSSAYSLWNHWACCYYLSLCDSRKIVNRWLPPLLHGNVCGSADGAPVFNLQTSMTERTIVAEKNGSQWLLNGNLPLCSNLVEDKSVILVQAFVKNENRYILALVPVFKKGIHKQSNDTLMAIKGASFGALSLKDVALDHNYIIATEASLFTNDVQPFIFLSQGALCLGFTKAALTGAKSANSRNPLLNEQRQIAQRKYVKYSRWLENVSAKCYQGQSSDYIQFRLNVAELALESALIEFQSIGSSAHLRTSNAVLRVREALTLSMCNPSLQELRGIYWCRKTRDQRDKEDVRINAC